jgi:GMP synthase (glutamine-hydrolysing)
MFHMSLPLAIWTTGSPVPEAEKRRGSFFEMIQAGLGDGFPGELWNVDSMQCPQYPDPRTVAGIIVSGSPARLATGDRWMKNAEEALREAHAVGTPILGICFGHQLLGSALGGKVVENPRGREIGTVTLCRELSDPLFDSLGSEALVVMSHLDSVVERPEGAEVLATTALEKNAVLRFSETTWGVQFHPEMDAEIIGYYLEARRSDAEAEGLDVDQLLAERRDTRYGAELLRNFGRFCANRAKTTYSRLQ